jgi:hypothetical protein
MSFTQKDTFPASSDSGRPSSSGISEAQLSNTRWDLQASIINLLREQTSSVSLKETMSSYNEVMDTLHNLEIRRRVDPLKRLPIEIVRSIILDSCSSKIWWSPNRNMERVLELTMVSRTWRNFILSEPILWNIILLDHMHDRDAMIALQLALSRDLPLTIKISLPLNQWGVVKSLLSGHWDRIDTIVLDHLPRMSNKENSDFRRFLHDVGSLPNLRRLGETIMQSRISSHLQDILGLFPSLVEMPNVLFSIDELPILRQKLNRGTLSVSGDFTTLFPIVETFNTLDTAHFWISEAQVLSEEFQKIHLPDLAPPVSWRVLIYQGFTNLIPVNFLSRLSSLMKLDISANLKSLYDIASIIHQFPILREVELKLDFDFKRDISIPPRLIPNLSIQSLLVHILAGSLNNAQQDFRENNDLSYNHIHQIPSMLLHLMPKVKYFRLCITDFPQAFPFSLNESFNGDRLSLTFETRTVILQEENTIPSSVLKLSLYCQSDLLHSMSSTSVKYLEFGITARQHASSTSNQINMFDLNSWPSLERIVCQYVPIQWSGASLAFLREVTICGTFDENVENKYTSFIRDIACHPESYPSLEDISLERCPEWDILMIMLERRNLLASSSTKRIKRLYLDSPLPSKIHKIISTLLAGKWAERLSNKELSLAGNADIILDLSL